MHRNYFKEAEVIFDAINGGAEGINKASKETLEKAAKALENLTNVEINKNNQLMKMYAQIEFLGLLKTHDNSLVSPSVAQKLDGLLKKTYESVFENKMNLKKGPKDPGFNPKSGPSP